MTNTLGDFIEQQLVMRGMSAREFAKFIDVSPSLISKFRNHGLSNLYAGEPVGNPSLEFLYKLSKATHVGIDSLARLIYPDIEAADTDSWLLANVILNLPDDKREIVDGYLQNIAMQIAKGER